MKADWSFLEEYGVEEQALRAARAINNKYPNVSEVDDLHQEARIMLALRPEAYRDCLTNPALGLGTLRFRLCRDLENSLQPELARRARTISYERAREGHE